uniref:Uncharacterized protein n=1 Tax=Amphimedon queenslandica TaxID=400682 RepID=A0A1X7TWU6_AMPQE
MWFRDLILDDQLIAVWCLYGLIMAKNLRQRMFRVCGDLLEVVAILELSTSSCFYPQNRPHIAPSNSGSTSTLCSLLNHSSAERPMEGTLDHVAGAGGLRPTAEH